MVFGRLANAYPRPLNHAQAERKISQLQADLREAQLEQAALQKQLSSKQACLAVSEASVRQLSMQVCVQAGPVLIALHTLGLTSPS